MHVGEAAAIGVERQFAAGGGVALGDETAGLAARHKAQIFEAVDRQMRESVVDHQIVHIFVMPGSAKALGPATRNAREEVKSSIWLTIGVSTLSPVPMRQTGFCRKSRARSAATRIKAPPPSVTRQHCNKRNG